jgi:uncharacterized protein (DUF302 family)
MSINETDSKGIVTKPSKYSLSETVERIQQTLRAKGLTLFAIVDHSGEAAKVGLKMQDAKLLLFGSPKAGTPLMVASPLIALDLPLKALIWKDNEGRVLVSYNSTAYLAERHSLPGHLTTNIAGIDAIIDSALSG